MLSIRRSEKTLKFDNIRVNKNEFQKSKEPVNLDLKKVDQMVVLDKFKHSDDGFKYFIGYKKVRLLNCYVLSYLKWVDTLNTLKTVAKTSFFIKDDKVWENCEQIWDVIKNKLGIKFHSKPIYEQKYLKAKVREFDGVIKTNFLGNDMPKENMYYTCIACITIDSVLRMNKKNYPQVYLEECKYKIKKTKMTQFINTELQS